MICLTKKIINIKAKLLSGNSTFQGVTSSICEDGLYMRTFPLEADMNIYPGSEVQVKLEPQDKEPICLNCRVKWLYKTPPHKLTNSIGVEIVDALPNYKELLKELL
ncbi:MAG: PilZ domain-containing protein [Thermodesulfovibrionia bacterium]|nr:PilZ domain-containing protein [Thermodesulfovibrionia bacterium]